MGGTAEQLAPTVRSKRPVITGPSSSSDFSAAADIHVHPEIANGKDGLEVLDPGLPEEVSGTRQAVNKGKDDRDLAVDFADGLDRLQGRLSLSNDIFNDGNPGTGLEPTFDDVPRAVGFGLVANPETLHWQPMPVVTHDRRRDQRYGSDFNSSNGTDAKIFSSLVKYFPDQARAGSEDDGHFSVDVVVTLLAGRQSE
jgi:hypothetical protein